MHWENMVCKAIEEANDYKDDCVRNHYNFVSNLINKSSNKRCNEEAKEC